MDPNELKKIIPDRSVFFICIIQKGVMKVSQTKECQLLLAPHDVINNGPHTHTHARTHRPLNS